MLEYMEEFGFQLREFTHVVVRAAHFGPGEVYPSHRFGRLGRPPPSFTVHQKSLHVTMDMRVRQGPISLLQLRGGAFPILNVATAEMRLKLVSMSIAAI